MSSTSLISAGVNIPTAGGGGGARCGWGGQEGTGTRSAGRQQQQQQMQQQHTRPAPHQAAQKRTRAEQVQEKSSDAAVHVEHQVGPLQGVGGAPGGGRRRQWAAISVAVGRHQVVPRAAAT